MTLGFIRAFALFLCKVPMILIGMPVVWLALDYTRPFVTDTGRTITRLPRWARWWDNVYDGVDGDARGWWENYCQTKHYLPATDHYCRWLWTALRNPANYFSRNVCGIDVSTLRVEKVGGNVQVEGSNGFYLLKGMARGGKVYPRFYAEYRLKGEHGLMVDIGWKIKLSHNGTPPDAAEKDRLKGIVLALSPWKELS